MTLIDCIQSAPEPLTIPEPTMREHALRHGVRIEIAWGPNPYLDDIRAIRQEAYELSHPLPFDPIDEYSHHVIALRDDRPIGCLRVTTAEHGPMCCEEFFPVAFVRRHRTRLGSTSRFCLAREARFKPELQVARLLTQASWNYFLRIGMRGDIIDVNRRAIPYYESRLHYRLLPDSFFVHPILRTPSYVMAMFPSPLIAGPMSYLFAGVTDPIDPSETEPLFQGAGVTQ